MSNKLFVLGHINGQLEAAFKKLASLHAKNNFSCAIVAGNLFGADEDAEGTDEQVTKLLAGEIPIPVSTYFTVGTRPLPPRIVAKVTADESSTEVCENLHYLGKRSVTKTAAGLRIVALGGRLDDGGGGGSSDAAAAGPSKDQHLPFHSVADEKALKGAHAADILLTAVWPEGITRGSQVALPKGVDASTIPASRGVADLVVALRPRYHLTASPESEEARPADFFYEREGFFHPERPDGSHSLAIDVTRFLSLAALGNAAKAKSMYAFALSAEVPTVVPAGCTPSPFLAAPTARKRAPLEAEPYSRFAQGHAPDRHGRNKRRRNDYAPPPGPEQCFFCLSNPNLPTHMVCSIGNEAYLATAKGPLPLATTFAEQGLGFPGHMLIVPLSHAATLAAAAGEEEGAAVRQEMGRFRASVQAMLAGQTQQKVGAVTWEISRARNVHVHWQVVPVAADLVRRGLVEAAFRVEAENLQLPKLAEVGDDEVVEGDYFRVWLWADGDDSGDSGDEKATIAGKSLVMRLDERARFDLQYGRKVLAKLMGLEARTVWRDCAQTEAEEKADVAAFRSAFAAWDFTLEE